MKNIVIEYVVDDNRVIVVCAKYCSVEQFKQDFHQKLNEARLKYLDKTEKEGDFIFCGKKFNMFNHMTFKPAEWILPDVYELNNWHELKTGG